MLFKMTLLTLMMSFCCCVTVVILAAADSDNISNTVADGAELTPPSTIPKETDANAATNILAAVSTIENVEVVVVVPNDEEDEVVDAGLAYQHKTAHRRVSPINLNSDGGDSALGIAGTTTTERELYEQSISSKRTVVDVAAEVIEAEPIDLPCHLLNEYQDRMDRNIHPFALNYTSALNDIVALLKDLQSQFTAEYQYVCPPTKMTELRKLLDVLGEIQSFHTRREQLRRIGGSSFGTLGPHCASHLIVASDVFGTWGVAAETLFNGLSASERHCTTGWANFLAFLSNAPGLEAPKLQTPECMKRPSYAKCFRK